MAAAACLACMEALYEGGLVVGIGVVELLPLLPGTGDGFRSSGDGEIGVGVLAADCCCCFCCMDAA